MPPAPDRPTPRVTLRPAAWADSGLLLGWRNDPATRAACPSDRVIRRGEHEAWLRRVLDDPDRLLMVAESGGAVVGSGRVDRGEAGWELSFVLAPEARGRGLAVPLVEGLIAAVRAVDPAAGVWARAKPDNVASVRTLERAGLRAESCPGGADLEEDGFRIFRLPRG